MGLTSKGTGVAPAAAKVTPLNPSLFPVLVDAVSRVNALDKPAKQLVFKHKPSLIPSVAKKLAAVIEPLVTVNELADWKLQAKTLFPASKVPNPAGKEVSSSDVAAPVALSFNPPRVPVTVPGTLPVTLLKEKVKSRALAASAPVKQTIAAAPPHFYQKSTYLTYFHDLR